jgi:hypothetical protein
MRLFLPCIRCTQDTGSTPITWAELTDDGLYHLECPNGHKSITRLQEQKFEVLFDLGTCAILDGYYREAVSSHASALERFYEFFSTVICIKRGVPEKEFLKTWKQVSNQSERQFGAFLLLYLTERNEAPRILKPESVTFRNRVIHKGTLPTRSEACKFGEEVLELISSDLEYFETSRRGTRQHCGDAACDQDSRACRR